MAYIYKDSEVAICVTPQVGTKTEAELEALTYVPVCCVENFPGFTIETNILTANCGDGTRLTAIGFKGESTAEVSNYYKADCPAADAMRAGLGTQNRYAVRFTLSDETDTTTASTVYAVIRIASGTIGGQGGGGEDWIIDAWTWALDQDPILVKPTAK